MIDWDKEHRTLESMVSGLNPLLRSLGNKLMAAMPHSPSEDDAMLCADIIETLSNISGNISDVYSTPDKLIHILKQTSDAQLLQAELIIPPAGKKSLAMRLAEIQQATIEEIAPLIRADKTQWPKQPKQEIKRS